MIDPSRVIVQISNILLSIRYSIDKVVGSEEAANLTIGEVAAFAASIERVRGPFLSITKGEGHFPSRGKYIELLDFIGPFLSELVRDEDYRRVSSAFIFKMHSNPRRNLDGEFTKKYALFRDDALTAYEATLSFLDVLSDFRSESFINSLYDNEQNTLLFPFAERVTNSNINALKRIVPPQKIAPIRFEIESGRIVIDEKPSHANKADASNIALAKEQIIGGGRDLIDKLRSSNCDRRLIENLEILHDSVSHDKNAVQIGINNISFGVISSFFKEELPDALNANLQSYNLSVGMYVAQFPDWIRFSNNAREAEVTDDDVVSVNATISEIIQHLDKNPHMAEPKVVAAFRHLATLTENPRQASRRAAFAVIRTAENLFSKIFQFAISFFEQVATDTIKEIQKTISKSLALSLVALVIGSASYMTGIVARINELSWIKNAIEIVQKQIKGSSEK